MLDRHLDPFLSHLEVVRHLSPHTISSYKRDLDSFFTFLKEKNDSLEQVQDHDIRGFVSQANLIKNYLKEGLLCLEN